MRRACTGCGQKADLPYPQGLWKLNFLVFFCLIVFKQNVNQQNPGEVLGRALKSQLYQANQGQAGVAAPALT